MWQSWLPGRVLPSVQFCTAVVVNSVAEHAIGNLPGCTVYSAC
jgi:hypothetical protein